MKILIIGAALSAGLMASLSAVADVEVVQKGYYEVVVQDQVVSQHSSYRKALESAINHNGLEAVIKPPEVTVTKDSYDITLTWEPPTTRVDGSPLEGEITYRVLVDGPNPGSYTVSDPPVVVNVPGGTWGYSVVAIDSNGLESEPSNQVWE